MSTTTTTPRAGAGAGAGAGVVGVGVGTGTEIAEKVTLLEGMHPAPSGSPSPVPSGVLSSGARDLVLLVSRKNTRTKMYSGRPSRNETFAPEQGQVKAPPARSAVGDPQAIARAVLNVRARLTAAIQPAKRVQVIDLESVGRKARGGNRAPKPPKVANTINKVSKASPLMLKSRRLYQGMKAQQH